MSDSFGLKIGIEGEREFKKSISDINSSFKVLKSEMNLVTSEFDKQDKSVQGLTARNKVLDKEIDAQKDKIATLEKALSNASESFGENDKRTRSWAVQLNNAKADLNGMEKELEQNKKALNDTSNEFGNAEKKADDFDKEIKKTGNTTDDAGHKFEKLGSVLKGIGTVMVGAMASIAGGAIAAGKSLYNMSKEAAAVGDTVDKSSQKLGLSKKGYQEWAYVLSQNGADIESLKTGLNKLNAAAVKAGSGNEEAAQKFQKLGISMDDLKNKSREEIFNATVKGLQGVTDESERAALASGLLGKSAVGLAPLLNQTAESTDELKQKANELGMIMSDDAVDASVHFTDSMDTLQRTIGGVKNSITAELLPGFTQVIDGLTGLLVGQDDAGEKIKAGARETVEVVAGILPKFLDILMTIIPVIAEVAPEIIRVLIQGFTDNLPELITAVSAILVAILETLVSILPQLTDGALQLVLALVKGILDNLPMIISAGIDMIVALAEGLADALPELIPSIIDAIVLICTTLLDNMDKLIEAAFKIIEGLALGLIKALPKLVDALPKLIDSIVAFVTDNLPLIIRLGIEVTLQIAYGIIKAIPQLISKLPQIVKAILNGIGEVFKSIPDIGKSIVEGLWNGISSMINWLKEKLGNFVGGIVNNVKGVLGIHSPSTVFAGIGENMSKGLGLGFISAMNDVRRDMQKVIPTDFNTEIDMNVGKMQKDILTVTSPSFPTTFNIHIDKFLNNRKQDVQAFAQELEFYARHNEPVTG